jgi:hypothetical protein
MADLQQIVAAILRDLAKARFSSDIYSRSIARYYENDLLLRRFSVPRADIEEVEVDLKFSIAEVTASESDTAGREANIAFVMERAVEEVVATFLDLARDFGARPANQDITDQLEAKLALGFNSNVIRIELRQRALRYLIESYMHLIGDEGRFDTYLALRDMKRPLFYGFVEHRKDGVAIEELAEPLNRLIEEVFKEDRFKASVEKLAEPIRRIWRANYDARLEVEVEGHKLAELSEHAISTIRIKAVVRNMVWNEVKVDERTFRRTLTSE